MKLSEIIAILEVKILSESEIDQDMKIHRINSLKDGKKENFHYLRVKNTKQIY